MTPEEYFKQLREINLEAKKKRGALAIKYATSNNPYKVGDVITDHHRTIKIEDFEVRFAFDSKIPQCVYRGVQLRKDGKPFKDNKKHEVYQGNIRSE